MTIDSTLRLGQPERVGVEGNAPIEPSDGGDSHRDVGWQRPTPPTNADTDAGAPSFTLPGTSGPRLRFVRSRWGAFALTADGRSIKPAGRPILARRLSYAIPVEGGPPRELQVSGNWFTGYRARADGMELASERGLAWWEAVLVVVPMTIVGLVGRTNGGVGLAVGIAGLAATAVTANLSLARSSFSAHARFIAMSAAAGVALAVWGWAVTVGTSELPPLPTIQTGECLNTVNPSDAPSVVICSNPHVAEVAGTYTYPAGAAFPGADALQADADRDCSGQISAYTGTNAYYTWNLTAGVLGPTETAWDQGDRTILCYVGIWDGSSSIGTLRDVAPAARQSVLDALGALEFEIGGPAFHLRPSVGAKLGPRLDAVLGSDFASLSDGDKILRVDAKFTGGLPRLSSTELVERLGLEDDAVNALDTKSCAAIFRAGGRGGGSISGPLTFRAHDTLDSAKAERLSTILVDAIEAEVNGGLPRRVANAGDVAAAQAALQRLLSAADLTELAAIAGGQDHSDDADCALQRDITAAVSWLDPDQLATYALMAAQP